MAGIDKSKVRILVVDDEQSIREMIGTTLREDGWSVELAENGKKGLEALSQKPCHIVMSDIQMPEMTGMELLETVKKASPHIEFIVMTSNATLSTAMQAIKFGAYDYLTKPFDDLSVVTKKMGQVAEKILLRQQNAELLKRLKKAGQEVRILFELSSELNGILEEEILEKTAISFPARLFQTTNVRAAWLSREHGSWKATRQFPDDSAFPFPEAKVETLEEIPGLFEGYRNLKVYPMTKGEKAERALIFEVLSPNLAEIFAEEIQTCFQKVTLHQNIVSLANRDGLTRVYNHRYFQDRLRQELSQVKRQHAKLSIIMLDVDYFKKFNDTHGHPTGDRLLIQLSVLLDQEGERRTSDVVARYGGEEFVLMLPFTPYEGALTKAERIRSNVENFNFTDNNGQPLGKVTVSMGVATFPEDADGAASLVEVADKALYQAKNLGRNRVEGFGKSNSDSKSKTTLATVLEETGAQMNPSLETEEAKIADPDELLAIVEASIAEEGPELEMVDPEPAAPSPSMPVQEPKSTAVEAPVPPAPKPMSLPKELASSPEPAPPPASEAPPKLEAPSPSLKPLGKNGAKKPDVKDLMSSIEASFEVNAKKQNSTQGGS